MQPEVKARWVAALRSGKYRQGKMALRQETGKYCCLGVLYEQAGGEWGRSSFCGDVATITYDFALLPEAFLQRVSLTDGQQHTLSKMNDDGATFAEIADYIEANL